MTRPVGRSCSASAAAITARLFDAAADECLRDGRDGQEEEHEPEKVGAWREEMSDEREGGKKDAAPQDRAPLSRSLAAVGHQ